MLDLEVAGAVRELTEADAVPLAEVRNVATLRDSHHALARALARGQRIEQASLATGYRVSRIYLLLRDPTFVELVEYYKRTDDEARLEVEARFTGIMADTAQVIHERLLDNPDSIDIETQLDIFKAFADRAGFAPISKSINKNFNVNFGDRLDALKRKDEAA